MREGGTRFVVVLAIAASTAGAILASAACSYDWTFTPDGGSTPATAEGSPNPPTDAPGEPPQKPLPPATPCKTSDQCGPTELCHFTDGQCGRTATEGTCIALDDVCGAPKPAGCACDGFPVTNACEAAKRRVDVDQSPTCKEGLFECPNAPRPCKRKIEYCRTSRTPGGAKCVELGACGAEPKCSACPEFQTGGCTCSDSDPTAVVVTCPE
jgi:hypothetical protein